MRSEVRWWQSCVGVPGLVTLLSVAQWREVLAVWKYFTNKLYSPGALDLTWHWETVPLAVHHEDHGVSQADWVGAKCYCHSLPIVLFLPTHAKMMELILLNRLNLSNVFSLDMKSEYLSLKIFFTPHRTWAANEGWQGEEDSTHGGEQILCDGGPHRKCSRPVV